MKTVWTKGLNEQEKKELRGEFTGSPVLRTRLITILNEKIKGSNTFTRDKTKYELSSWAYLQADAIGYERALNEVISLISSESVVNEEKSK